GVIFMLGTQRLELDELPPAVRDQAKEEGRKIEIAPLAREAVHELVDAAGVTHGVNRDDIFERSEGHPLSVRYIVEGLLRLGTDEERQEWLANGPSYGGDVSTFYESAWRGLETNPEARRIFGYLALAEGAVDPARLDEIVDRASTDAAWRECLHLLRIDRHGRWSIFHNSFRLFLLEKTSTRFGLKDPRLLKERYIELAQLASRSSLDDPQRWMELRYNARADEDEAVLRLAAPHRLRAQFVEGRNPADIYADIRLAFRSVRTLRAPT
ncbi:MAG: hypothetical protein NT113_09450, partial [Hyphomicrobiales bacterium]|nr:hypothetical protein [Hyphomicrobiales bacterium]